MNVYNTIVFWQLSSPRHFLSAKQHIWNVDDNEPNLLGLWWILCVALMVGWNDK